MKKFTTLAVAVALASSAAFAEESVSSLTLTGGAQVEIAENSADNLGAETQIKLGADAEVARTAIRITDGTIDRYSVGATVGAVDVDFGKQGDLFLDGYEGTYIADPSSAETSVKVGVADTTVLVGFSSKDDLADIQNVQLTQSVELGTLTVTGALDYVTATEDFTYGATVGGLAVAGFALGGTVTYADATEVVGYEATAGFGNVTAFVGGDENGTEEFGAGYAVDYNGLVVDARGIYTVDSEEVAPKLTVSYNF